MMDITIWERGYYDDHKGEWFRHNHIENGRNPNAAPTPTSPIQTESWKAAKWRRSYGALVDGVVHRKRE